MRWLEPAYLRRRAQIEIERLHRYASYSGLLRTADDVAFRRMQNQYAGKPCFIIGNGPSLTIADLDRIHAQGWPSIASNKIFLAFDDTSWRPDLLTAADKLVVNEVADAWRNIDCRKAAPNVYRDVIAPPGEPLTQGETIFFRTIPTRKVAPENYKPKFSTNPLFGLFVGQTVTVVNIQLAAWLGCNPIVVIGIDGKYSVADERDMDQDYGAVAVTGAESNHFTQNYRKPGDRWAIPRPDLHEIEYAHCREKLEAMGITICNASRTSWVKAFERRDLDEVFETLSSSSTALAPNAAVVK